jgi:glucans biosynthesis protein
MASRCDLVQQDANTMLSMEQVITTRTAWSWNAFFRALVPAGILTASSPGLVSAPVPAEQSQTAFSFDALRERARRLAAEDHRPASKPELPEFLRKLSYDQYQAIRYRPERGPWRGDHLRFDAQFFPRGYLYSAPVRIHLVKDGRVSEWSDSPEQFDYGKNQFPSPVPPGLGFAGFRLLHSAAEPTPRNEVASFLGASYFRFIGDGQRYGASCRGLAIDTGEAGGEEFPRFTEFWLEQPGQEADLVRAYALMDSPSAVGAYRFELKPGPVAAMEVEACLFVRQEGRKIGLAPLTSMFWMGENRTRYEPDFRPEVHDSDGLLLRSGAGEWIWRPLMNPEKRHGISRFPVNDLRGFGLLQRDRDFRSYEDLGARYELRPGYWVVPRKPWGPGTVELVEIPTANEYNDNIVAYWVPEEKLARGGEYRWTYGILATASEPDSAPLMRARATRINPGRDNLPPRFVVDFSGAIPSGESREAPPEPKLQAPRGAVSNLVAQPNPVTGGWRVFFDLAGAGSEPVEMRLHLARGSKAVSETWVYHYRKP